MRNYFTYTNHLLVSAVVAISLFLFFILIFLAHTLVFAQAVPFPAAADEIIIKYKASVSEIQKDTLRKGAKTQLKHKLHKLRIDVLQVPENQRDTLLLALKHSPLLEYAEPNYKASAFFASNDTSLSQQWGLFKINAANTASVSAWDVTHSNQTVKIAILDTGIEESHPDLNGKVIANSNFTTSSTVMDQNGHGTHVAGIAAAATGNGTGIAGTGYDTVLLNGKVLGDNGSGYYSWIINGILWAADQGANVISMSIGGSASSIALEDAINYAWSKGAVVIVAAGNNGNSNPSYPAFYTNAIAVAATDANDQKASWSNFGNWVDVAAPGVSIYSTYKGSTYALMSGTSMATPFVAGEAALIFASGLCSTNTCVRSQLEKSADPISGTGSNWTWGRINAYTAVQALKDVQPTVTPTPTPTQPLPTATPTKTPTPTSTPVPTKTHTVKDITMSSVQLTANTRRISTTVTVVNEATGAPLSSATVKLSLTSPSGKISSFSATTTTAGKVTFKQKSNEKGTFKATVTNVTRTSYTYHPTLTTQTLLVQ